MDSVYPALFGCLHHLLFLVRAAGVEGLGYHLDGARDIYLYAVDRYAENVAAVLTSLRVAHPTPWW